MKLTDKEVNEGLMNRKKAEIESINNKLTFGELIDIVNSCDKSGMSKLNKSLTKEESCRVLMNWLKSNPIDYIPETHWFSDVTNRKICTVSGLGVSNVLIECT